MVSSNFKYLNLFSGLGVIFIYYSTIISSLDPFSEYSKFLSLAIATDGSYLSLLLQKDFIPFMEGINFSFIPFIFDQQFIALFGLERLWFINIIYKSIAFITLIIGLKILFDPSEKQIFLLSLMIGLFFCIEFPTFADRYPRPQFSNIFFFGIFVFNLCLLENKGNFRNLHFLFYGLAHACLALTNPWTSAVLAFISLFSILKIAKMKSIAITCLGFISFIVPIILFFVYNSSSHSEYLGLKSIYSNTAFFQDYFLSIISNRQILIIFSLFLLTSMLLKRKKEINIFLISIIIAPLPFLIIGKTIQTYHLVFSVKDFLTLLLIINSCYLIQMPRFRIFNLELVKFNFVCFVLINLISMSMIFKYGNSWVDRAQDKAQQWEEYGEVYRYLDNVELDCQVISNDWNVNYYWTDIIGSKTYLTNGFISNIPIEIALNRLNIALNILSDLNDLNNDNVIGITRYATHNYFAGTRSTLTASLADSQNIDTVAFIESIKNINTMEAWSHSPPNEMNQIIKQDHALNEDYLIKNKILAISTKKDNKNIEYKVRNYCF